MRKALCLLLTVVLLMSLCTGALAETGYETIKAEIDAAYGEGYSLESEEMEVGEQVLLFFNLGMEEESAYILLYGRNADGNDEGTIWLVEDFQALALFALYCNDWEDKAALVSEGYTLAYMLDMGEDEAGEPQYGTIDNAEDARMMFDIINGIFGLEEV